MRKGVVGEVVELRQGPQTRYGSVIKNFSEMGKLEVTVQFFVGSEQVIVNRESRVRLASGQEGVLTLGTNNADPRCPVVVVYVNGRSLKPGDKFELVEAK